MPAVVVEEAFDEEAARRVVDSIPTGAVRQLDEWAKLAVAMTMPVQPQQGILLQRRFADAVLFANKWLALRDPTTECVLVPDGSTSPETMLLERFFEQLTNEGWLYRDRQLYSQHRGAVSMCSGLEVALTGMLHAMSGVVQEHFQKMPASVRRVAELIHDTFLKENRSLQVDSTRIMFENHTAQLSARGIDVIPTPLIHVERPLVPRACIRARLNVSDHVDTSWTNPDFIHPSLLSFVGALFRPSFLRRDDSRSLLLLATCPETVMHPLLFMLRTFCDMSITTKLPDDVSGSAMTQPYIFLMEAQYFPLTDEKMTAIQTALSRDMVVVVHASVPPPMFFLECHEYLRLCTVHVHAEMSLTGEAVEDVIMHLLPASQAAYNRELLPKKRQLSFCQDPSLYPFRLDGRGGALSLLLEMLQCQLGILLRSGGSVTFAEVEEAYAAYVALRKPGIAPEPVNIADVVQAARVFRDMFGYRQDLPIVVYTHDRQTFHHMSACASE